ncbi:MAG: DUF4290 domain-containing protein [Flavobacteriales bacterium]
MEYNTQRGNLTIPEYGRNVQKMINFAMTVKERELRNTVARSIIKVMGQLSPHLRDVTDFNHKLWDQLIIMSDFNLDVDSPYPYPDKAVLFEKPKRLAYPTKVIKNKHYGFVIEDLISKASVMENPKEKHALTYTIANMMKKAYISWNKESVSDKIIIEQLGHYSGGKLSLDINTKLEVISEPAPQQNNKNNNNQKKNNFKKGGGHFGKNNNFKKKFK